MGKDSINAIELVNVCYPCCNTDERTLGGLFRHLADEFNGLDWAVAFTTFLDLLADISAKVSQKIRKCTF